METNNSTKLTAQWEKFSAPVDESSSVQIERVQVYRGALNIAHVSKTPVGWKVFPHGTGHKVSRKGHVDPAAAIKSFYGKSIHVFAAPEAK